MWGQVCVLPLRLLSLEEEPSISVNGHLLSPSQILTFSAFPHDLMGTLAPWTSLLCGSGVLK